jgi:hypothetical protein
MKKLLLLLLFIPFIGFSQSSDFGEKTGCTGNCTNGYGVWVYRDGARYEGNFKNGKKNGQGTLTSASGKKQSGKWINGVYQQSSTKTNPSTINRAMEHKNQIGYITNFTSHPWGGLNYFYPYLSDMGFYIDWRPSGNALHPDNFTNTGYDQYYFVRTDHTLWTSVTNLGVSYRINNSSSSALMIYGGIGNARTKTYSGYLSYDGEYFYYEDGERISKINLNFGVLRQTKSVISWQVGFDSAVKGINFGIGYTWE